MLGLQLVTGLVIPNAAVNLNLRSKKLWKCHPTLAAVSERYGQLRRDRFAKRLRLAVGLVEEYDPKREQGSQSLARLAEPTGLENPLTQTRGHALRCKGAKLQSCEGGCSQPHTLQT